jgi:hypothetical protein
VPKSWSDRRAWLVAKKGFSENLFRLLADEKATRDRRGKLIEAAKRDEKLMLPVEPRKTTSVRIATSRSNAKSQREVGGRKARTLPFCRLDRL